MRARGLVVLRPVSAAVQHMKFGARQAGKEQQPALGRYRNIVIAPEHEARGGEVAQLAMDGARPACGAAPALGFLVLAGAHLIEELDQRIARRMADEDL